MSVSSYNYNYLQNESGISTEKEQDNEIFILNIGSFDDNLINYNKRKENEDLIKQLKIYEESKKFSVLLKNKLYKTTLKSLNNKLKFDLVNKNKLTRVANNSNYLNVVSSSNNLTNSINDMRKTMNIEKIAFLDKKKEIEEQIVTFYKPLSFNKQSKYDNKQEFKLMQNYKKSLNKEFNRTKDFFSIKGKESKLNNKDIEVSEDFLYQICHFDKKQKLYSNNFNSSKEIKKGITNKGFFNPEQHLLNKFLHQSQYKSNINSVSNSISAKYKVSSPIKKKKDKIFTTVLNNINDKLVKTEVPLLQLNTIVNYNIKPHNTLQPNNNKFSFTINAKQSNKLTYLTEPVKSVKTNIDRKNTIESITSRGSYIDFFSKDAYFANIKKDEKPITVIERLNKRDLIKESVQRDKEYKYYEKKMKNKDRRILRLLEK